MLTVTNDTLDSPTLTVHWLPFLLDLNRKDLDLGLRLLDLDLDSDL